MTTTSPPYAIKVVSPSFIQARVFHLRTAEDVDGYAAAFADLLRDLRRPIRPTLLADHRPVAIYPPAVADGLAAIFADMNSRLDHIAILVRKTNATLVLQLERLVREAALAKRRVFFEPPGALAHIAPHIEATELVQAKRFLAEYAPPGEPIPSSR